MQSCGTTYQDLPSLYQLCSVLPKSVNPSPACLCHDLPCQPRRRGQKKQCTDLPSITEPRGSDAAAASSARLVKTRMEILFLCDINASPLVFPEVLSECPLNCNKKNINKKKPQSVKCCLK